MKETSDARGPNMHLRAVVLPAGAQRDMWCVDGRLSFERPQLGASAFIDGGYAIPGLVDAHCHVGLSPQGHVEDAAGLADQALADRDSGVLLIRDAGSPVDNSSVGARADLPRLIRAGRHIARPRRYLPGIAVEVEPADLVAEVERQVAHGDGWIKLVGDWIDRDRGDLAALWPVEHLRAAISRAHELGARVTAHVFSTEAIAGLLDADIDCLEHATGLTHELAVRAAAAQVAVVPTMANVARFGLYAAAGEAKFPRYAATMRELHGNAAARMRTAYELGVPLYAGTDCGGTDIPHGSIVEELTAMERAGLPTAAVLAAGSWGARAWLGLPGLVEGAPADVVVYADDPRRDLAVLRSPSAIVLRGIRVF